MAFRFNPFTGKLDFDTTNDGLASSYASNAATSSIAAAASASNAATSAGEASTSATNAATSATNAALSATDAGNTYQAVLNADDFAHSLFFKANASAYNISTNIDFGGITASADFFDEETGNTLLSMVIGSSSFDYGSV